MLNNQENNDIRNRMRNVFIVIYSLICVLGTIGNGLVIFITGFRMKKTVHTICILNLAIADFTFSCSLIFHIVCISLDELSSNRLVMCKLNSSIIVFNLFASTYLLMVISIDRCVSAWCPVWSQNHRTLRQAFSVVFGVWILALVFSSTDLYFALSPDSDKNDKTKFNRKNNLLLDFVGNNSVNIFRFSFGFIIPFNVIVACYGAIIVRLRRHQLSQSGKPFKVITGVIVAFFVCWLPFHVLCFFGDECRKEPNSGICLGFYLTSSLAYFNSCLNPILYFFMGHNFKEKLRCSLFSAFANVFVDDSNHNAINTRSRSSADLESQNL